jgi:hypothetical protein
MPNDGEQSQGGQDQGSGGSGSGQQSEPTIQNPIGTETVTKSDKTPSKTYEVKIIAPTSRP